MDAETHSKLFGLIGLVGFCTFWGAIFISYIFCSRELNKKQKQISSMQAEHHEQLSKAGLRIVEVEREKQARDEWYKSLHQAVDTEQKLVKDLQAALDIKPPIGLSRAADWTLDDRLNFRKFLESTTGTALMNRMRHVESKTAVDACKDSLTTTHSAARASGISDSIEWLLSMARDLPISGAPAAQDANHPTTAEQDEGQPVEIRRSF